MLDTAVRKVNHSLYGRLNGYISRLNMTAQRVLGLSVVFQTEKPPITLVEVGRVTRSEHIALCERYALACDHASMDNALTDIDRRGAILGWADWMAMKHILEEEP